MPEVSFLLPVRNAERTIARAVASCLGQSLTDLDVVVVDDGSTDATPSILAGLAARDARLRIVTTPARGLVHALNTGIEVCTAPLIARMDADDESHPDRAQRQRDMLKMQPELGVVGSRVVFGGDPEAGAGYARHVAFINRLLSHEDMALARFRESPLAHPSVMFRRDLVAQHGGYREGDFPEDYELWLRWFEAGVRFGKVDAPLLVWNDPPDRLSRGGGRYDVDRFVDVRSEYLARWLARNNPFHPLIIAIGAGRITRRRIDVLRRHGIEIAAYADIDRAKVGRILDGAPVIHHDDIPAAGEAFVVPFVGKVGAADYIRELLEARGYVRARDFIEAA